MKSEYLQTLVESVTTGSFSKAAENLFITQSAVSRRIKFLEDQYGYLLIDRSGPVLLATEAGRVVMEKAGKILQIEDDMRNDLRTLSAKPEVSFCSTPSFGITYLPEIMKGFMLLKPDMLELRFFFDMPDKIVDGMKKGMYQVGVIEHKEDYDYADLETFELPGDEVVFVSSPQLGLEEEELSLERLACFDLYSRKEGCCSNKLLEYNLKRVGSDHTVFNRTIYYDDLSLIISSVLKGDGLAFLSRSVIEKFVSEGTLRIHRASGFDHGFRRTLIINRSFASAPLLASFIEEIKGVFKKYAAQIDFLSGSMNNCDLPFAP